MSIVADVELRLIGVSRVVREFCDKRNIELVVYFDKDNDLIVKAELDGLTISYCKGCLMEIRALIKKSLNCKAETILEAY